MELCVVLKVKFYEDQCVGINSPSFQSCGWTGSLSSVALLFYSVNYWPFLVILWAWTPFVCWLLKWMILYLAQPAVAVWEGTGSMETKWACISTPHLITGTFNIKERCDFPALQGRCHGLGAKLGVSLAVPHTASEEEEEWCSPRGGRAGQGSLGVGLWGTLTLSAELWGSPHHALCAEL